MLCPLCGYEYDADALGCSSHCPMAAVQGCNLLCCPNCGYQMVDERKSGIARLLRKVFRQPSAPPKGAAPSAPPGGTAPPARDGTRELPIVGQDVPGPRGDRP